MTAMTDAGGEVRYGHPWLAELIFALDSVLRRRYEIIEFTDNPACIFRLQLARAGCDITLSDGTRLQAGERIIDLHFWNEHIPPVPENGPTIGWAKRLHACLDVSLRELARFCAARRELNDIRVIRANLAQGTRDQSRQLARIMARYGFEAGPDLEAGSAGWTLHRMGENILISLMVLAQNPVAFRSDSFRRDRTQIFLSRRLLARRYGRARRGRRASGRRARISQVCAAPAP
jgi:hypothetical protein